METLQLSTSTILRRRAPSAFPRSFFIVPAGLLGGRNEWSVCMGLSNASIPGAQLGGSVTPPEEETQTQRPTLRSLGPPSFSRPTTSPFLPFAAMPITQGIPLQRNSFQSRHQDWFPATQFAKNKYGTPHIIYLDFLDDFFHSFIFVLLFPDLNR